MKQTRSAINMLISAYKAILSNCFKKSILLMGGGVIWKQEQ